MRRPRLALVACLIVFAAAALATRAVIAQEKPAETGKLAVTVQYAGKGAVDASHRIWIWVFDTPNITAESMPVSVGMLAENGGTYKFSGLPKEVYLALAYDENGGYDGSAGPPPSGTPIAIHGAASGGAAAPVVTGGDDAVLKVTFDDSARMP